MSYEPLPPYRAMFAVDMENFSAHEGRDHADLTARIPNLLEAAFARAGDRELWVKHKRFSRSDGDGFVAGFPPRSLPFLLNPVLRALQDELAHQNQARHVVTARPMRMRVSINVGPVTDSGMNLISDGSGSSRVETHRLLDAPAVKDALRRSGAETYVAAIVSARAFEDAVLSGYAGDDASYFRRVSVEVKSYRGAAYLRVPNPTGELLDHGFRPETQEPTLKPTAAPVAAERYATRTTFGTVTGPVHAGDGPQYNQPGDVPAPPSRRSSRD